MGSNTGTENIQHSTPNILGRRERNTLDIDGGGIGLNQPQLRVNYARIHSLFNRIRLNPPLSVLTRSVSVLVSVVSLAVHLAPNVVPVIILE